MNPFLKISLCAATLLTLSQFAPASAVAQSFSSSSAKVYTVAEREPEFPGGKAALSRYLASNIKFPNALTRNPVETGPIAAKFIVDELGYVRDVRVTSKPLTRKTKKGMQAFMANIITAVEKMPRWNPGEVAGRPVAVFYTLPIEVSM